ncbi:MAG: RBBP9/YdeN family alpha/beta hydrolase [Burkholderiaceae bacterium]
MVARFTSDFRVLILPGLNNSGPDHWQTRWQQRYPHFERVEQVQWNRPQIDVWSDRLDQVLRGSAQPTLVIAHSFGCLATVHRAGVGAPNLMGALLVAPADPAKFRVAGQLRNVTLSCHSIVIGSTNDPWMEACRVIEWANVWGSEFINAGELGHINAESGLGDWLCGLTQLERLFLRAQTSLHHNSR